MKKMLLYLSLILIINCSKNDVPAVIDQSSGSGYYTLEGFLNKFPEEESKYNKLKKLVRESPVKTVSDKEVSISVIYPGLERSDYWFRSVKSFEGRMKDLGIKYELFEYFTRPGQIDNDLMEEYIAEALSNDPDYLVFTMDVNRHKELLERIITIGKPKIILQNITTPLKEWDGNHPMLYVGFSHRVGTIEILIPEFLKRFPNGGSYSMLYFTQGFVSSQRGDTFIFQMNKQQNINLLSSYYTDGQYDRARSLTKDIVTEFPDINFIYACSTNIALGVVDELKELGLIDTIQVNGWGGGSSELNSILKKDLDFTVMRINDDNGIAMAEAIKMDIEGRSEMIPKIFNGDFALITQETSIEEINELKRKSFRYSDIEE